MTETARRVLCITASSAQSERDFSSVGHNVTDLRNSLLSPFSVEAVQIVREGLRANLVDPTDERIQKSSTHGRKLVIRCLDLADKQNYVALVTGLGVQCRILEFLYGCMMCVLIVFSHSIDRSGVVIIMETDPN